ncbi:MAG: AAA family ATPase [Planctomycetota bacterium]
MRITRIHIDGFGLFHDLTIDAIPRGLSVFCGGNEAGKTTLLAFVRAMFFGFPDGRSRENAYLPIRGGRHGGQLELLRKDGARFLLERHAGPHGGRVGLVLPDGSRSDEKALPEVLGPATRDLFARVFAFSLEELQNPDSLDAEQVKAVLYSAALGLGGRSLAGIDKRLLKERETLFKPRGSAQRVNALIEEWKAVRQRLDSLETGASRYDELRRKRERSVGELEEIDGRIVGAHREAARYKALSDAAEDWGALRAAEESLAGLALTGADAELLGVAPDTVRLQRGRDQFDSAARDLPGLRLAHEAEAKAMEESLRSLGAEWTGDKVRAFDASVAARDRVRSLEARLREAENRLREAQRGEEVARRAAEEKRRALSARADRAPLPIWPGVALFVVLALFAGLLWIQKAAIPAAAALFVGALLAGAYFAFRARLSARQAAPEAGTDGPEAETEEVRAVQERARAEAQADEARAEWAAWLSQAGLREGLSPTGVLELFTRLGECRGHLKKRAELSERIRAVEADAARFRQGVAGTWHACAPDEPMDPDAGRALDCLSGRLEEARQKRQKRDTLQKNAAIRRESLRRLAREFGSYEELLQALSTAPLEEIQARRRVLAERLKELEETRNRAARDLGGLDEAIRALEAEGDASMLRLEGEGLLSDLNEAAEAWGARALAQALLKEARARYEKEHQPAVVRDASRFFSLITGGAYARVGSSLEGEGALTAVDALDREKGVESLSRGTREELYLAVRLGLIREFGARQEPLPVVLDDVFVNFDPPRARAALTAVAELAKTHQVLLFTCHPETVRLAREAAPGAVVYALKEGQLEEASS